MTTNASDEAMGAVVQQQMHEERLPLAFFSKQLGPAEKSTVPPWSFQWPYEGPFSVIEPGTKTFKLDIGKKMDTIMVGANKSKENCFLRQIWLESS